MQEQNSLKDLLTLFVSYYFIRQTLNGVGYISSSKDQASISTQTFNTVLQNIENKSM